MVATGIATRVSLRQSQIAGILADEIIEYALILCDFTPEPPASTVTPVSTTSLAF
jgi:hypothetical protein